MSKGKKYDYRVVQQGADWRVEIVRQVTSKKTMVSKQQDGFSSETKAQTWAREALKLFTENLSERNKRHSEKRALKAKQLEQKKHDQALAKAARLAELTSTSTDAASVWKLPSQEQAEEE